MRKGLRAALCGVLAAAGSCARRPAAPPLYDRLAPSATGVTFANLLPEAPEFNIVNYIYYYNGGGVAAGDVNGDGLPDLYFTSNLGKNRLYLNRGSYKFEDVTDRAGVGDSAGWKTGVTMADVNGDGRPDLYVSGVDYRGVHGHNVLYVNNGDGTFTDRTREYGLDYAGYSTQATFFDYDGDGDLDMFLVTHLTDSERKIGGGMAGDPRVPRSGGVLYRNDGVPAGVGPGGVPHFTDVTQRAGMQAKDGYGLGVVVSDLNGDGCPDLYETIDFQGDDRLWLNNCDGTFRNVVREATRHTSRFSMGVDAADVTNTGRPSLFVADMFPDREDVLKTSASTETWTLFNLFLKAGYHPQYSRNTLQLNRGVVADSAPRPNAGGVPRFSDVGYLAGVNATDWTWSALFADLDNDGRKDLFITNGIYRRLNDLDYINYVGNDAVQAQLASGTPKDNLELLRHMPQVALPNHAFHNNGDLTFTDRADAWGLGDPGFSNGAVYVDLNNSGALDLVVNHVAAPAAIYRNRARERNGNAYLTVALRGQGANTGGVGAKVWATAGGVTQLLEEMPTRGFLSSVDPRLHFGLGRAARVDSLVVVWPDRRFQVLRNVAANRLVTLAQSDAAGRYAYPPAGGGPKKTAPNGTAPNGTVPDAALFADATAQHPADYKHEENEVNDFDREPLMTHQLSTEGPALAVGDVDGDGLDDVYAGGAKWQPGKLLLQQRDGSFRASPQPAFLADSVSEDVDAQLVDVNGDGHPDLVVASGGNEFFGEADALRPRLYLNDGRGNFGRVPDAFPGVFENASCVVAGDFDGDGRIDLFVGARVVSRQYGAPPRSHLLKGDGAGHFTDVTATAAPALADAGMVTSAAWVDYDRDGRLDLVVVGEFTPVHVYHNEGRRLVERTREAGLAGTEGWWNSVRAADLTGTGRQDLVLGNLGLNTYLRATADEPARMYVGDFGHNGTLEQVLTFYKHGVSYPVMGRDDIVKLVPALRSKYPSYAKYGAARVEDIFPEEDLRRARVLEARTFASAVARNNGDGTFALRALPAEAQFAPVYASLVGDFDRDGRADLLLGGNFWGFQPLIGRADASYGTLLRGVAPVAPTAPGGKAGERADPVAFAPVPFAQSGLLLDGQVRRMAALRAADGSQLIVVARNNDRLQFLRAAPGARQKAPPRIPGHAPLVASRGPATRPSTP